MLGAPSPTTSLVLALLLLLASAAGDDTGAPKYAPGVIPMGSPEGYERLRSGAPCLMTPLLLARLATQVTQFYCSLASLVTVFNALEVRPSPDLFGYSFWTQQNILEATGTVGEVHPQVGLTLAQLTYVASKRANATAFHAGQHGVEALRESVRESLVQCGGHTALTVNFQRAPLTLKGGGHHSVLAAYHNASDSALLLDVATYKFPPMWVPLPLLHAAMATLDPFADSRGWVRIDASDPAHLPPSPPLPADPFIGLVAMLALSIGAVLGVGMLLGTLLSCCWRKLRARRSRGAARAWVPLGERYPAEGEIRKAGEQGKAGVMTEV
ncbi:Phytochelatin synthase-domain-containing protein [Baffinella frigidus]|nr:Phytochelatin synthase-domain-containing protein [Cryptophyta sp. CCMP2293]